jgi:hypothetical protein
MALLLALSGLEMAQDGLALPLESGLSVLEEPGLLLGLEVATITAPGNAFAGLDESEINASGGDGSRAPVVAAVKAAPLLER